MKFITLENLKTFLGEIKRLKIQTDSRINQIQTQIQQTQRELPGKIEYWNHNINEDTLKSARRLICNGRNLKKSDYPDLYNALKKEKTIECITQIYTSIENFEDANKNNIYYKYDDTHFGKITEVNPSYFNYIDANGNSNIYNL